LRSISAAVALALALAAAPGCKRKEIQAVSPSAPNDDHGRAALDAAVARLAAEPTSPAAYRTFAVEIARLRPAFNLELGEQADLHLAFRALPVLEKAAELAPEAWLEAMALTVLPTAFDLEPTPGETARDYGVRLCKKQLLYDCSDYVGEALPLVVGSLALRALHDRAQDALDGCHTCPDRAALRTQLERYDKLSAAAAARLENDGGAYDPRSWPLAGEHAAPATKSRLFELGEDGDATLDGEPLPPGRWRRPLAAARGRADVLAVHLLPRAEVRTLREIARHAAAAGYSALALHAREREYPYSLREYRIGLRRAGRKLDVSDVDTVQILVRALELRKQQGDDRPPGI
jgi:hypothetical protein